MSAVTFSKMTRNDETGQADQDIFLDGKCVGCIEKFTCNVGGMCSPTYVADFYTVTLYEGYSDADEACFDVERDHYRNPVKGGARKAGAAAKAWAVAQLGGK